MKYLILISVLLLSSCTTIPSSLTNYEKIEEDAFKEKTTIDRNTTLLNNLEKGLVNQCIK